jgi:hypothetical protein
MRQALPLSKVKLGSPQGLLGTLKVIDVSKEEIPRAYLIFCVSHRKAANLEPSVHPIRTPAAVLHFIDPTLLNGPDASLDDAWKVIRMNDIGQCPVFQVLSCLAEILQSLTVEKLDLTLRAHRRDQPGDVIDDLSPGQFPRLQDFLCPLPVLDVKICSVPPDKVA